MNKWSLRATAIKSILFMSYLNFIYRLFLGLFYRSQFSREKNLGVEIHNSGILGVAKWSHGNALSEVRLAHTDLSNGNYFDGINRLINFHESLYELHSDSNGNFYPPILSREWTNAFGHIPNIGSLIKLKEKGYLEEIPNRAILSSGFKEVPILETFGSHISFLPDLGGLSTWSQLPSFLHLFLGQNVIWTKKSGFVPLEWQIDRLYRDLGVSDSRGLRFDLPSKYMCESEEILRKIGFLDFSKDEWFVALHIRNSGDASAKIRDIEIERFQLLVEEIGKLGGKVARICTGSSSKLPDLDFVLDCARFPDSLERVHLYLIAKARVFVGTSSGPYAYPKLFGTPSLVTNMTNIGRACFPSSSLQEYLPMRFYKSGRELSLFDLLQSPAGWADCSPEVLKSMDLQAIPNSPEEIRDAFLSILRRVTADEVGGKSSFQLRVDEIRSTFEWTSTGNFSESFLQDNEYWLS